MDETDDRQDEEVPGLKDYVSFTIALLQTLLLPILTVILIMFALVLIIVYL